jgi:type IV pilus assembly protein PilO
VTLHNLALAPTKDAAGNLSMDAVARTYRYLDVMELAEVRKVREAEAKAKQKAPRK